MRISTTQVPSVMLRSKKLEIREKNQNWKSRRMLYHFLFYRYKRQSSLACIYFRKPRSNPYKCSAPSLPQKNPGHLLQGEFRLQFKDLWNIEMTQNKGSLDIAYVESGEASMSTPCHQPKIIITYT
jgi:hypothetical protein